MPGKHEQGHHNRRQSGHKRRRGGGLADADVLPPLRKLAALKPAKKAGEADAAEGGAGAEEYYEDEQLQYLEEGAAEQEVAEQGEEEAGAEDTEVGAAAGAAADKKKKAAAGSNASKSVTPLGSLILRSLAVLGRKPELAAAGAAGEEAAEAAAALAAAIVGGAVANASKKEETESSSSKGAPSTGKSSSSSSGSTAALSVALGMATTISVRGGAEAARASPAAAGKPSSSAAAGTSAVSLRQDALAMKLHPHLLRCLERDGFTRFFPVQRDALPVLLAADVAGDVTVGDVCISAPTGSGKTLVYALPILHSLLAHRQTARLRALVLVPTRDLAQQVLQTFERFTAGTGIHIAVATGQRSFREEQRQLKLAGGCDTSAAATVGGSSSSSSTAAGAAGQFFSSLTTLTGATSAGGAGEAGLYASYPVPDILIATPGRLTEHLDSTPGFTLQHLRFFVVDEADRLLGESFQEWPQRVQAALHAGAAEAVAAASGVEGSSSGLTSFREARAEGSSVGFPLAAPSLSTALSSTSAAAATNGERSGPSTAVLQPPSWFALPAYSAAAAAAASGSSSVSSSSRLTTPLRRIVCSATLTANPRKLATLHLHYPLHFLSKQDVGAAAAAAAAQAGGAEGSATLSASAASAAADAAFSEEGMEGEDGKRVYLLPSSLGLAYSVCNAEDKPIVLLQLLRLLEGQASSSAASGGLKALIFTGSQEAAHRLTRLLQLFGGLQGKVLEFSASLSQKKREAVLEAAKAGVVTALVATDVAARGLDLPSLPAVIHYEPPNKLKTLVHRVGRAARAGAAGLSYALLRPEQARHWKGHLSRCRQQHLLPNKEEAGAASSSSGSALTVLPVRAIRETVLASSIAAYKPRFTATLAALRTALQQEASGELKESKPLQALKEGEPAAAGAGLETVPGLPALVVMQEQPEVEVEEEEEVEAEEAEKAEGIEDDAVEVEESEGKKSKKEKKEKKEKKHKKQRLTDASAAAADSDSGSEASNSSSSEDEEEKGKHKSKPSKKDKKEKKEKKSSKKSKKAESSSDSDSDSSSEE